MSSRCISAYYSRISTKCVRRSDNWPKISGHSARTTQRERERGGGDRERERERTFVPYNG